MGNTSGTKRGWCEFICFQCNFVITLKSAAQQLVMYPLQAESAQLSVNDQTLQSDTVTNILLLMRRVPVLL